MDAKPEDIAPDAMSVTPADPETGNRGPAIASDAGTDESISERLARNPESKEARLDRALDESMDASDPPASTQPVHSHSRDPAPSSGYDALAERKRADAKDGGEKGVIGKLLGKLGIG